MPNPIVHFEILGKDKAALEAFYSAIFDWQLNPVMDEYSMIATGGGLNGGLGTSMDGGAGHITIYVEVENLSESISRVESRGGQRISGPDQVPNGPLMALVSDPEGHIVGLVQAGSMRNG